MTNEFFKPFIGVHSNVSMEGTEHWVWKHSEPRLNGNLVVTVEQLLAMGSNHINNAFTE